jgi:hypothetical protein
MRRMKLLEAAAHFRARERTISCHPTPHCTCLPRARRKHGLKKSSSQNSTPANPKIICVPPSPHGAHSPLSLSPSCARNQALKLFLFDIRGHHRQGTHPLLHICITLALRLRLSCLFESFCRVAYVFDSLLFFLASLFRRRLSARVPTTLSLDV